MLDESSRRKLGEYAEGFESAQTLDALRDAVVEATRATIDTNGVCFLPMGPGIPFGAHGAFSHDEFSSDTMRDVTLSMAPVIERDCGSIAGLLALPAKTLNLNQVLGPRGLERTEMFNEYWHPYRLDRQVMALFGSPAAPLGLLCVSRSGRQAPFTQRDVLCMDAIRVRLRSPLERLVRGDAERTDALPNALAAGLPTSSVLFDALGRVIWASAQAEQELGLRRVGSEWSLSSSKLAAWGQAAIEAILQRRAVFRHDDLLVQRVEMTPGVPAALVTRQCSRRETVDERVFTATRKYRLTPRESEVLLRLGSGLSNKEIANDLGCGLRTVEVHVSAILKKRGCTSRTELVAKL